MKIQGIYQNTNKLIARHCLSKEEITKRLLPFYIQKDIDEILLSARAYKSWTDTSIIIIYFKDDETYSIITSGMYIDLIE